MSSASASASLVTFTATATAGQPYSTVAAAGATQAVGVSILSGGDDINPIKFVASEAIQLLIVQLFIIICLSRILSFLFVKFRQPRVVAEILAGILLGPTAFGRIPGFTENIFPAASIPFLNLLATLGLVLFLFVIGLEVDFTLFRKNLKPSLGVSLAGLCLPFGLGCAVAVGLYNQFIDKSVKFTTFMCFIGTSSSITAFPVLGRILTELRLMNDPVGVVVLASGVANDVIGWMLLALSVALATAGQGVVVVYILLTTVGWSAPAPSTPPPCTSPSPSYAFFSPEPDPDLLLRRILFLYFICRPLLNLLGRKTGSYGNPDGPTQTYILAVLMLVLISAWFMQSIGISNIFGGFLVGLIVPHSVGHHIAAKIEDLVLCIFIPLYFASSGLRTNLTLLNTGIIWGWVVCVIACAFCGKFFGCFGAAKLTGFSLRESAATGFLMSAKGLIELIVLNQGLTVGIINETVFSIFVLEALLLTFAATPCTLAVYPPHVRRSINDAPSGKEPLSRSTSSLDKTGRFDTLGDSSQTRTRFTVVIDKLESMGALFILTKLLAVSSTPSSNPPTTGNTITSSAGLLEEDRKRASPAFPANGAPRTSSSRALISLTPLRLVELTERASAVMLASDAAAEHLKRDPLTALYRTFAAVVGQGITVPRGDFAITGPENFAETVATKAEEAGSEMILVPWKLGESTRQVSDMVSVPNPFEHIFGNTLPGSTSFSAAQADSSLYAAFLRDLFATASCDVGLFLDRSSSDESFPSLSPDPSASATKTHLFLPFFGGADDRACLELAVQLAKGSAAIKATVLVVQRVAEPTEEDRLAEGSELSKEGSNSGTDDATSTTRLDSRAGGATTSSDIIKGPALQLTIGGTHHGTHHSGSGRPGETVYPTQNALASATADDLALEQVKALLLAAPASSIAGSIELVQVETVAPLRTMVRRAASCSRDQEERLVFLVGRARRDAASHRLESLSLLKAAEKANTLGICASPEVRRCLGEAAAAAVVSGVEGAVWVVQSGLTGGKRRREAGSIEGSKA
ncbi:SPOSA6832_00758 [Sporobolomyces salmonicolor]|uniref:SPOSA6832_00758-mRNA-1:cds n=1 Tax=Sporidiobolus salmonicolor TaxID=5005 RepID=A0A0D6EH56_SPOSA|nr:SPOSA6832_00758 [Sporobolomyces salmonicolor]